MEIVRKQDCRYVLIPNELYIYCQNSTTPWEVKDISMGGLSFEYSPIHGEKIKSEIIDIVGSNYKKSELSGIPCSVIFDYFVLSVGQRFSGEKIRRRGVKFNQLMETQARSLELLLENLRIMPASMHENVRFHTLVNLS
ncbi:MAG: hypothetical protein C0403_15535 [Desulfobacterium sp.]|nr:hypothetical protein [Desulfobacterium sp.]